MIYIYNTNNKTLTDIVSKKEVDLTEIEWKFIEVICNGEINTWKQMLNYMYDYKANYESYCGRDAVQSIKCRLLKKINLNIKTIIRVGYKLLDTIYIDRKEI